MAIDPTRLVGLWERTGITYWNGTTDSSLFIYWMQSRRVYADIRIPRDHPTFRPGIAPDDLTLTEMRAMARCGGFGGTVAISDDQCRWRRDVDLQPDSGQPDIADLDVGEAHLIEVGGACGGHQTWLRRSEEGCGSVGIVLSDLESGATSILVALEGRFVFVRGRVEPLDPGSDLSSRVDAHADDPSSARALFDAEASCGSIDPAGSLRVEMSSLPWRVGGPLMELRDIPESGDVLTVPGPAAASESRRMRVVHAERHGAYGGWRGHPDGAWPGFGSVGEDSGLQLVEGPQVAPPS